MVTHRRAGIHYMAACGETPRPDPVLRTLRFSEQPPVIGTRRLLCSRQISFYLVNCVLWHCPLQTDLRVPLLGCCRFWARLAATDRSQPPVQPWRCFWWTGRQPLRMQWLPAVMHQFCGHVPCSWWLTYRCFTPPLQRETAETKTCLGRLRASCIFAGGLSLSNW